MGEDELLSGKDLRRDIDALREQVAVNRGDIDALLGRADASSARADASEALADKDRLRIEDLEARVDIDRELIMELQESGVLRTEQVAQLEEALRTSRTIGAAIGMVMAKRVVTQDGAFALLKLASQHSNRKLRDIAEELVLTGDTAALHRGQ